MAQRLQPASVEIVVPMIWLYRLFMLFELVDRVRRVADVSWSCAIPFVGRWFGDRGGATRALHVK